MGLVESISIFYPVEEFLFLNLIYFLKDSQFCCTNKKKNRLFYIKKKIQQANSHEKLPNADFRAFSSLSSRLSWQHHPGGRLGRVELCFLWRTCRVHSCISLHDPN